MHFFDGSDEFGAAGALQKIAAGSGAEAVEDGVAVVVGGEHEHLQGGKLRLELRDAFDAALTWQIDVYEQHIGRMRGHGGEGAFGIGIGGEHFEAFGESQQLCEALAGEWIIFDDGDADHL